MSTNSSESLDAFKSLAANLRDLLDTIEIEVSATIQLRNPHCPSFKPTSQSSEILVSSYRKFVQLTDELATYAAEPSDHVTIIAGGFHESKALQVMSEFGVADALGTQEVPLISLANSVGADPVHLRQCLRSLVNRGVFRETAYGSDIFANNRMSSILLSAHENNLHGFIGHWCEDAYRASTCIIQALSAENAEKPAFEIYQGMPIWDYYLTPEGASARDRLNKAMIAAEPLLHGSLIFDYNWTKHGEDITMIDIGRGIGGAAIEFTRRLPKLKVIIQDRASVLMDAPRFWDEHAPECKPRVTFMPHDFFTAQPRINVTGPRIYFMRLVLHDWKDEDCIHILRPIVAAMKEEADGASRLYIADAILDANSDRFKYMVSLQMMTLVGALERSEHEFRNLLEKAGVKIENIWRNPGFTALIECVPA